MTIASKFTFTIGGIDMTDECVLSAHYIKSHPSPDPDTFELRVLPECGVKINFFDTVEIKKHNVTEFYGFVEEITPEVGEDGLEYLITGRCWKLTVWKKQNERFQESREVGPIDSEGNIETGFFGEVKPEELVRFIMRCPMSEHPKDRIRHKIGWGIASDYWKYCANLTADCFYPAWVGLRYTGLSWRGRAAQEDLNYEKLVVNAFDSTHTDWDVFGASPYLNTDSETDRIQDNPLLPYIGDKEGWFGFTNLSSTGVTVYGVKLYIKALVLHSVDKIAVYLNDGTTTHKLGYLKWTPWAYGYTEFNLIGILDTPTKINDAKIYFEVEFAIGTTWHVKVMYAYLNIEYSTTSDAIIGQQANDNFIVDMSSEYDDVMGILIECRNNPNMYARHYTIQHANLSNCCNGANPPREDEWNDFTPAVNVADNEVRDILHSWEPEDGVRCVRIKLTMSDCNSWEISQIYIWQADEHKYRLMDEGD